MSSIWLFLKYILSKKPVIIIKWFLSSVDHSTKLSNPKKGSYKFQFIDDCAGDWWLTIEVWNGDSLVGLSPQNVESTSRWFVSGLKWFAGPLVWCPERWRIKWFGQKIPHICCQKWCGVEKQLIEKHTYLHLEVKIKKAVDKISFHEWTDLCQQKRDQVWKAKELPGSLLHCGEREMGGTEKVCSMETH